MKAFLKGFTLSFCVSFTIYTTIIWGINGFELNTSNNCIYPHGSNAVYLGHDNMCVINRKDGSLFGACYIDMLSSPQEALKDCSSSWTEEDDRNPEEDFNYCLQMHKELNNVYE